MTPRTSRVSSHLQLGDFAFQVPMRNPLQADKANSMVELQREVKRQDYEIIVMSSTPCRKTFYQSC
jgi:hypothetical protein